MAMTETRTYARLELSQAAYDEIKIKLKAAGYSHAFTKNGVIDMHGIGVAQKLVLKTSPATPDHHCDCSVCVERSDTLRQLVDSVLIPGIQLTVGGRPINHTELNDLKERAGRSFVR